MPSSYEVIEEEAPEAKGSSYEEVAPEDAINPLPVQSINTNPLEGDMPYLDAFLQGGSLGYWDEGMARLESYLSGQPYRQHWQERQDDLKRLRLLYPAESMAGEAGGAIATSLIPLGWAARLAKGAKLAKTALTAAEVTKAAEAVKKLSLAKRFGQGAWDVTKTGFKMAPAAAGYGALQSVGSYEKPLFGLEGEFENPLQAKVARPAFIAGKGAVEGVMSVPLALGVGALAKPVVNLGGKIAKPVGRWTMERLAKPLFGVDRESAKHILQNPELYQEPLETFGRLAKDRVIPKVNEVSRKATAAKADAVSHLTDKRTYSVNELENMFFDPLHKRKLVFEGRKGQLTGSHGPGPVAAFESARETIRQTAGAKGYVTEKELHDLYEHFSDRGLYRKPGLEGIQGEMAKAYREFRAGMNQKLRKNTEYNDKMTSVRKMTDDLENMKDVLRLQKTRQRKLNPVTGEPLPGEGRYSIDKGQLEGKLRGGLNTNEHLVETVDDFWKTYFPEDVLLSDLMKRAAIEQKLAKGGSAGFRTLASEGMPWPVRAAAATLDMYGRPLFKKAAMITTPNQSAGFDSVTRAFLPAVSQFGVGPWTNPYYVGFPFHGMSGEEYRKLKEEGKVK